MDGRGPIVLGLLSALTAGCASLAGLSGGSGGDAGTTDARHPTDVIPKGPSDATRPDAHGDGGHAGVDGGDAGCTMCSGACVDTTSDPSNCGGCGITCQGCTRSYCASYMDESSSNDTSSDACQNPTQTMPALAFVSPLVYWAGAGSPPCDVNDNILTGNSPTAKIMQGYQEQVIVLLTAAPVSLATDSISVFVGGTGYLASFTPPASFSLNDAGKPPTLEPLYLDAGTVTTAGAIAADQANVYWADWGARAILQMPKTGGEVITLFGSQDNATGLAVDTTRVYWIASKLVLSTPIGDTSMESYVQVGSLSAAYVSGATPLIVHDPYVYWADPSAAGGTIYVVDTSGGSAAPLESNQPNVTALATDGTSLYWTTSNVMGASVVTAKLSGGATTTIASFPADTTFPGGFALSAATSPPTVFVVVQTPGTTNPNQMWKIAPPPTTG